MRRTHCVFGCAAQERGSLARSEPYSQNLDIGGQYAEGLEIYVGNDLAG